MLCHIFGRYGKQCGPRSDCSIWSSLIWVHTVCMHVKIKLFESLPARGEFCHLLITFINSLVPDQA